MKLHTFYGRRHVTGILQRMFPDVDRVFELLTSIRWALPQTPDIVKDLCLEASRLLDGRGSCWMQGDSVVFLRGSTKLTVSVGVSDLETEDIKDVLVLLHTGFDGPLETVTFNGAVRFKKDLYAELALRIAHGTSNK